jgi:uncharacterized Zn-finger protein
MPDSVAPVAPPGAPAPTEIIHTGDRVVACDQVMCPYCSRLYVLNEGADHGHDH